MELLDNGGKMAKEILLEIMVENLFNSINTTIKSNI